MAAARNPLRRWYPFLGAFASVDGAIEAADPGGLSRDEFRRARARIVEMLRGAEGDAEAEGLCLVLDDVMAESLLTLRIVPVTPKALATTDLAGVVGALRKHESERIRGLATDIVRGWRAVVKRELVKIGIAMEKLSQTPERVEADQRVRLSSDLDTKVKHASPAPPPKKHKATADGSCRVNLAKTSEPERIEADQRVRISSDLDTKVKHATPAPPPKKKATADVSCRVNPAKTSEPERIEADQRVRLSSDLDTKVKHATPAPPPKKKATADVSCRVNPAKTSQPSLLAKTRAPVVGGGRAKIADMGSATKPKEPWHPPKKLPAAIGSAGGRRDGIKPYHSEGENLTAAPKRKLDWCQEAEEAQKQRKTVDMGAAAKSKEPVLPPKKLPAVVASAGRRESIELRNDDEKIAAAKRKLREGYQEAEEAKKRRNIHVIEDPEMLKQRQQKMHPILRLRSRAIHATSMAEKSSLMSSIGRL